MGLWSVTERAAAVARPGVYLGPVRLLFAPDNRRLAGRCIVAPPYGDQSEELAIRDLAGDGHTPLRWSKQLAAISAFAPAGQLIATDSAARWSTRQAAAQFR